MNEYYTAFTGGGSRDGGKGETNRLEVVPSKEANGEVLARDPVSKLIGKDAAEAKATNPLGTTAKLIGKAVASAEGFKGEKYTVRTNYTMNKLKRDYYCVPIIASLDSYSSNRSHLEPFTADDDEDWAIWIRRFNDRMNMASTPLTDRQKALHLIGNLAGRARDAVDTLNDTDKVKYEAVVNKVVSLVNGPEQKAHARRQLTNCRQQEGESVMAFVTRLRRIVHSAMQGKEAVEIEERLMEEFVDRITPRLAFNVKAKAPETLEEALGLARRYECLLATMANSISSFGESPNIFASQVQNVSQQPIQSAPASMESYDEEEYDQYGETPFIYGYYCHRCGVEGHIRRECPLRYAPNAPFQPEPYYPVTFQNAMMQQPLPVYQPVYGIPQYQAHLHHPMTIGQVPTTYSGDVPESNESIAQTTAELKRKLALAERRYDELIQKQNATFDRY